jgi:hypothetical protein
MDYEAACLRALPSAPAVTPTCSSVVPLPSESGSDLNAGVATTCMSRGAPRKNRRFSGIPMRVTRSVAINTTHFSWCPGARLTRHGPVPWLLRTWIPINQPVGRIATGRVRRRHARPTSCPCENWPPESHGATRRAGRESIAGWPSLSGPRDHFRRSPASLQTIEVPRNGRQFEAFAAVMTLDEVPLEYERTRAPAPMVVPVGSRLTPDSVIRALSCVLVCARMLACCQRVSR